MKDGESPAFNPDVMTIKWSPTTGVDTDGDGDLTPTAVLDHEMDHALGFVNDSKKSTEDSNTPDKKYDNKEEKRVITGSEQSTAKKLGITKKNETTRKSHGGTLIKTAGVNTTQPQATEIQEVVITAKKKK